MVLVYSSIYAKITNDGLGEFLDDFELDLSNILDEIDLPGLDLDNLLPTKELPAEADEPPSTNPYRLRPSNRPRTDATPRCPQSAAPQPLQRRIRCPQNDRNRRDRAKVVKDSEVDALQNRLLPVRLR